jgi:hypothetical protein
MDPQIRAEAMQLLKYAEKYETIDIRDVNSFTLNANLIALDFASSSASL